MMSSRPTPSRPQPLRCDRRSAAPSPRKPKVKKLFVLDTNVLMHDPTCLFRFEEHDVYLPMMTLEELDNHKKGMSEVARNARQVSRFLDEIVSAPKATTSARHCRSARSDGHGATGRLFLQTEAINGDLPATLPRRQGRQPDPRRGALPAEAATPSAQVVLVSKDINMRIKARALGPRRRGLLQRQGARRHRPALHRRARSCPTDFWDKHGKDMESLEDRTATPTTACAGRWCRQLLVNEFVYRRERRAAVLRARARRSNGKTARARRRCATTATPRTTCGASPRATASRTSRSTC